MIYRSIQLNDLIKQVGRKEVEKILAERKKAWKPKENKYKKGVLKLFADKAVSPMKGGYME